jgi:ribosome biogenesis GTPase
VLSVHGLASAVRTDDGREFQCATRRVLKNLSTDQRHVVAAGDVVLLRPESDRTGVIERIEPRRNTLCRTSKGRQHVLVTNVDQLVIVASVAEPGLKPNLIDRFLVEKNRIRRSSAQQDRLVEPPSCRSPACTGKWVTACCHERATGQGSPRCGSGRGKGVSPAERRRQIVATQCHRAGLALRVGKSVKNEKGGTPQRLPATAGGGGFVVDTPGIRQFQLWDIVPEEVAGYYRDIRPYVSLCRFPDCTHTHEASCAVKDAVADGKLDARRYESYCREGGGDAE